MNANTKVSEQCRIVVSKGNQVLGMIRRNIIYKEKSLYCTPVYSNSYTSLRILYTGMESISQERHIYILEKIQNRASKFIPGLRDLRYEERLK